jgi:hypothetical protein
VQAESAALIEALLLSPHWLWISVLTCPVPAGVLVDTGFPMTEVGMPEIKKST